MATPHHASHLQDLIQLVHILCVSADDVAAVDVLNAGDVDGDESGGGLADAFPEQDAKEPVSGAVAVDEASGDDAARGGEEFGVRAEWGAHDEDVLDESADRLRVDRGGAVDELVDELFDAGHDDLGAHGVCDEGHGAAARAALEEDVCTDYDLL